MKVLEDMKELLEEQLKKINRKGDAITPQELDNAYKAVDILKDIETIYAMRNANESESYGQSGASYGRYPYLTGNSWEYGMNGMEPYSRTGMDMSGDESYARGRNPMNGRYMSRDSYDHNRMTTQEEKEQLKRTLDEMRMKIDQMK